MVESCLHDLVFETAYTHGERSAVEAGRAGRSYAELAEEIRAFALGLRAAGLQRDDRVAIYLDKRIETVTAIFGAMAAGGIAVPCNPVLKPHQVEHILADSGAAFFVSTKNRILACARDASLAHVKRIVSVDSAPADPIVRIEIKDWQDFLAEGAASRVLPQPRRRIDTDIAAILYTSGSTGRPKGVVLSHRNMVVGARSVAHYIGNTVDDRILALLQLSFDAGLSQITTAFSVGATVVLHNYLTPHDVPKVCQRAGITGITCVPPLWMQLLRAEWPEPTREQLRYFANTGGRMPRETLTTLRTLFPNAKPYLMYGLTEAFRSTYLDPTEVDRRPDSIGKAIPNAEILVARPDGTLCEPGEEGELVHRGPLVSLGYWNDSARTAERFRPAPGQPGQVPLTELAVWSGDVVKMDEDGFLYFVGRRDEMIKVSGFRLSPAEVEEVLFASRSVSEAAVCGVEDEMLGQRILAFVVPLDTESFSSESLLDYCRQQLPSYMIPSEIRVVASLPRSANGKIDRRGLVAGDKEPVLENQS